MIDLRLLFLTLAHRIQHPDHEPDWLLLVWRWECRECIFGRARP